MYRRFGFETAGVRKNYYAETNEDALDHVGPRHRQRPPTPSGWPAIEAGDRPAPPSTRRPGRAAVSARHRRSRGSSPSRPPATRRPRRSSRTAGRSRARWCPARPTCTPASAGWCPRWPAGPMSTCSPRSSAEAMDIADATPRRPRTPWPPPSGPGLIGSLLVGVSAAKALRPGVGGPVRRRQPPRGPPARRLPRGPRPGPAGGGAAGVGRPHHAHPHAGAGPLPPAGPDHRRRRRRGVRQGGAVPRPRLPGRTGHREGGGRRRSPGDPVPEGPAPRGLRLFLQRPEDRR